MQHVNRNVSETIRTTRMELKMTQKELAEKINEKPQVVQDYESAKATYFHLFSVTEQATDCICEQGQTLPFCKKCSGFSKSNWLVQILAHLLSEAKRRNKKIDTSFYLLLCTYQSKPGGHSSSELKSPGLGGLWGSLFLLSALMPRSISRISSGFIY